MTINLIATAPSLDRVQESINRYFCGSVWQLQPSGPNEWKLSRLDHGDLENFRVILKKGRYRFESGDFTTKPTDFGREADPDKALRELWTDQGVSQKRQDELIAEITAKAQPGAKVGPFTIPYRVQLTPAGEQYMIPGTEPEDRPKTAQLSLF